MDDWSFQDLDLSDVQTYDAPKDLLTKGRYHCRIGSAKIEQTRNKNGTVLLVAFRDTDSEGVTFDRITIRHSNPDAMQIGQRRLKTLLVMSDHPNPDAPGDISSLVDLEVGVVVGAGETYTTETGETKTGNPRPLRSNPFFPVEKIGRSERIDDEVPF